MSFLANKSGKDKGRSLNVLMLHGDSWIALDQHGEIIAETIFAGNDVTGTIAELADKLSKQGIDATEDIILALDARRLFTASVNSADLPKSNREKALIYKLEELLPIDAEHFTADFWTSKSSVNSNEILAVAAITENIAEIVQKLEARGLLVTSIISGDLAVAAEIIESPELKKTKGDFDYLVFADSPSDNATLNIFKLGDSGCVKWLNCCDTKSFERIIRSELLHHTNAPDSTVKIAVECKLETKIFANLIGENIELHKLELQSYRQLLHNAVSGGKSPIDLRRGELAAAEPWARVSGHLKIAGVMLTIFWLTLAAAFMLRGNNFSRQTAGCHHELRSMYSKLYPNSAPPANILGRLKSELEKLGASADDDELPQGKIFVLDNLRHLLANVPPDMRLRVLNITVSPKTIIIEGQLRSHGDAEKLRESIAGKFLTVDPPRTERIDRQSVSFTMTAHPRILAK